MPECDKWAPKSAGCLLTNGGLAERQGTRKEESQWSVFLFHPSGRASTAPPLWLLLTLSLQGRQSSAFLFLLPLGLFNVLCLAFFLLLPPAVNSLHWIPSVLNSQDRVSHPPGTKAMPVSGSIVFPWTVFRDWVCPWEAMLWWSLTTVPVNGTLWKLGVRRCKQATMRSLRWVLSQWLRLFRQEETHTLVHATGEAQGESPSHHRRGVWSSTAAG